MFDSKRYKNRIGVAVSFDELTESERDWHALENPHITLETWCHEADLEPDDTARGPVASP